MAWQYPARLTRDTNGTILVEFPDVPEAITFGDNEEEALAHAQAALATALEGYIKDRRAIPVPSRMAGPRVALPALVAAKVDLYRTMRAQRIGKAELGRRLHWHPPQVDRLLDVHHGSQLHQLEAAFCALGKRLVVDVTDAPVPRGLATDGVRVSRAVATSAAGRRAPGARGARGGPGVVRRVRRSTRATKKR